MSRKTLFSILSHENAVVGIIGQVKQSLPVILRRALLAYYSPDDAGPDMEGLTYP